MMSKSFIDPEAAALLDDRARTYVYVDWTAESVPRPYYVGQGDRGRVLSLARNELHRSFVAQHGIKRCVVAALSSVQEANDLEVKLTAELKTQHGVEGHWGANKTRGGRGTKDYKHTAVARQHMRETRPNKRSVTQHALDGTVIAVFESQREAQRVSGVPQSNIKTCCQRKLKSAGKFIWRYSGDSFERKEPAKMRPHKRPSRRRAVEQLALDGTVIATHQSVVEATRSTGTSNIVPCCKGVRKSAGGYRWRYVT